MEHLVSSQPAERARKEEIRRQDRPTKSERREKELAIRRWLVLSRAPRSKWLTRKPRTNTRLARHDLDN